MAKRIKYDIFREGPRPLSPTVSPRSVGIGGGRVGSVPSNELQQLAKSLGKLQPSLERYAQVTAAQEQKEGLLAGQLDELVLGNRKEFENAVRSGQIDESENPWYDVGRSISKANLAVESTYRDTIFAQLNAVTTPNSTL